MDRARYLSFLRHDAEALLSAASGHLERPVPSCPGWSVERLVGHVGRVYRWTAAWVASGATPWDSPSASRGEAPQVERAPDGEAVLPWTEAAVDLLVTTLEAVDPSSTVATWAGEQPAIFWPRRMAIETALHRWDVQNATGDAAPVDPELASYAIDEFFGIILPQRAAEGIEALDAADRSLHLHATDIPGEWLVTLRPRPRDMEVEHVHAKGDVAARGAASDLLLFLWNRGGVDRLEVFGERELLERWSDAIRV
jgi:uncharacterized protein (TIGR03083 family)